MHAQYGTRWIGDRADLRRDDDNVDVIVKIQDGTSYVATFFTLQNLATLLQA